MGKGPGFYKSDKRKKEVTRQKKQEEKRLRRQSKAGGAGLESPETGLEVPPPEGDKEGQASSAD